MKNWQELITKTGITAAVLAIGLSSVVAPAKAGWDPIKNTPLDPGTYSGARDSVRDSVRNEANGNKYRLYVKNKCHKPLKVTLKYMPTASRNTWFTRYYDFSPGERAYLVPTHNRYVYLSAKENYKRSGGYRWNRKQINMGKTFTKYTYSFTCNS